MHGEQQPRPVVRRPAARIDHDRAGLTCRLRPGHCVYRFIDRGAERVRCTRCGHERRTRQLDPACCRRVCTAVPPMRTSRLQVIRGVPMRTRSRGLGDTIAWLIGLVSFGRLKAKRGCGCRQRQAMLNRWWRYGKKEG